MGFPLAALAPIVGGALDAFTGRERQEDAIAHAERQEARSEALQREFAQHGIRWRVEDARSAGIHPVYAMSGGGAAYAPSAVTVGDARPSDTFRGMGQDLSRAITAQETAEQRSIRMAVLEGHRASAERDLAQAQYYRTLANNAGRADVPPAFPSDVVVGAYGGAEARPVRGSGHIEQHPLYADAVKLEPDVMASRSVMFEGETAGRDHPSMRQFAFPGGFRMLLPAAQGGGIPEEIDVGMLPLVLGANLDRYGGKWLSDFWDYMTGGPRARRNAARQRREVDRILERR